MSCMRAPCVLNYCTKQVAIVELEFEVKQELKNRGNMHTAKKKRTPCKSRVRSSRGRKESKIEACSADRHHGKRKVLKAMKPKVLQVRPRKQSPVLPSKLLSVSPCVRTFIITYIYI